MRLSSVIREKKIDAVEWVLKGFINKLAIVVSKEILPEGNVDLPIDSRFR
jgi:hypothetical protein